jgi:signal transduction histidine kinase
MHDLLETIRERFVREGKHHLYMDIVDRTPGTGCICEWKLMETAIQNLVNNAARYASACIRIEYGKIDKEWYLLVEDDGPGIPLEQRERIFDSFVRLYHADAEGESQSSGFGLGLAIVKRIMQWHKGQVRALNPKVLTGASIELRWPEIHIVDIT